MKTRISALMDGELDEHEVAGTLDALHHDEAFRRQWSEGQLIADALREQPDLGFDVTAQVMAALEQEPTVLAPRPPVRRQWQRPALALAATVAGVAVVAWLGLGPVAEPGPAQVAQVAPRTFAATVSPATPRLQEYMVAHQAHGALVGGTRNIRTVSATAEGR